MTTIARCFAALVLVATIGGCANIGARAGRAVDRTPSVGASEELALLQLAEKVEAAARAARQDLSSAGAFVNPRPAR